MHAQITQLVKSIFQKQSLDECTVQELDNYAARHPYFGAVQLLLAKKLQKENPQRYDEQLQKTFLYFHNPLWVNQVLNDIGNNEYEVSPTMDAGIESSSQLSSVTHSDTVTTVANTEVEDAASANKQATVTEHMVASAVIEETETPMIEITNAESYTNAITENTGTASIIVEKENPENETMVPAKEEQLVPETINIAESEIHEEESEVKLPAFKFEPVDVSKTELLFQPYHTVDYFASQGINFREEQHPKDKFGKQLKSFTEWLKDMKKLPDLSIKAPDKQIENKVDQLAEHSVLESDVVTEAMAEVWEKQGNINKAIDIYIKLSLLDPSKSAYFATKIDELKKF